MENPLLTYLSRCGLPVTLILASGISSPAATPVVWFRADAISGVSDASPLATWPESSGYGNNASRSNPSQRPTYVMGAINGLPVGRFSAAVESCLNFPRVVQDDFTIVCVFQSTRR
ncbi:MAG: hypothetical protein ACLQU3_29980 [Limisphaerales bacterium]